MKVAVVLAWSCWITMPADVVEVGGPMIRAAAGCWMVMSCQGAVTS